MANGFTAGGASAPYPSNGYPGINFMGAGQPGRVGVQSQAARTAARQVIPSSISQNHTVAILLVVLGGYLLWHMTARMGR